MVVECVIGLCWSALFVSLGIWLIIVGDLVWCVGCSWFGLVIDYV